MREATCQQHLFDLVVSLQRDPGVVERPVVRFAPPEEVLTLIEGDVPGCHGVDLEQQRRSFLNLMGLAAPHTGASEDADLNLVLPKALYLHERDEVVFVDRSEPMTTPLANYTLCHEYVHAIQDQTIDLSAFVRERGGCFDARLALAAAVEGEAVRAESIAREALFGRTATDSYLTSEAEGRIERVNEKSLTLGSAADSAFALFPYAYGERWAVEQGQPEAFGELLVTAPADTRSYLVRAEQAEADNESLWKAEPASPLADKLGAWLVYNVSALGAKSEEPVAEALRQTTGYLDDALVVDPNGDDPGVTWRTRWESLEHAEAFRELMQTMLDDRGTLADISIAGTVITIRVPQSPM